ncbi:phosphotransferase [Curtobacterium sp. 9128]|uniref:phosphotransferase n=1 Tax=Curtobacterium sp. 9128 TaxID=1793722 RepID=UPI0011AA9A14|nr:phosphotransferase [Curtobacterium sp. 9128]
MTRPARRAADDQEVAAARRRRAAPTALRQGAVGQVRVVERDGRTLVEKRMRDLHRHDTEVTALRALAESGLPVPELVDEAPGVLHETLMPGGRLDELERGPRRAGLVASMALLRQLHRMPPPSGLPSAPDDTATLRRYHAAGGPPLPTSVPAAGRPVFCHGDWTDGNLLAVDGVVTAVLDWEAAIAGDPLRELARIAWAADRDDPGAADALVAAYGADPEVVRAWMPVHAAELWLWFVEAGPPEYLARLTNDLEHWRWGGLPPV